MTPAEVARKVDQEGLEYCIRHYFGPALQSDDAELNAAWSDAHEALDVVERLLPDAE